MDLELGKGFGYGLQDLEIAGFELAVTWGDVDGITHWPGSIGRELLRYLREFDEVVGYNLLAYDNRVLSGYLLPGERRLAADLQNRTVDLHALLFRQTGRRYSLQQVASATLGEGKLPFPLGDDPVLVAEYCQRDVELTRDLDDFLQAYGLLYVSDGEGVLLDRVVGEEVAPARPAAAR